MINIGEKGTPIEENEKIYLKKSVFGIYLNLFSYMFNINIIRKLNMAKKGGFLRRFSIGKGIFLLIFLCKNQYFILNSTPN